MNRLIHNSVNIAQVKFLPELQTFNFPNDHFIITASGALALHGIRQNRDLDIVVSSELYELISTNERFKVGTAISGELYYSYNEWLQIFPSNWPLEDDFEDTLSKSIKYEGVRFISLEDLLDWKMRYGRAKDVADANLIRMYLKVY